jgi:hypothetical protein
MSARRKINRYLQPQESKTAVFKRLFKIDEFMNDDEYAAEMTLLIIDVVLRQGYVAIPVQPKTKMKNPLLLK